MTVAENLKRIRTEKGLTQKKLAELCGISEGMIRQYELGLRKPKIETLKKIANALDIEVYFLDTSLWARVSFSIPTPTNPKLISSKGQDLSNIINMIETLDFSYLDILENDILSVAFDDGLFLENFYVSLDEINKIIAKYEKEKLNRLKLLLTEKVISVTQRNIEKLQFEIQKLEEKLKTETKTNEIIKEIQELKMENEKMTQFINKKMYSLVQGLQTED